MSSNGQLTDAELSPIAGGGQLANGPAAGWNAMAAHILKAEGVRIAVTGSMSAYRTYAQQVYFWNLYLSGQGNLAARPGTSNHGWGINVDVPAYVRALIDKYGAQFGWSKSWSDAPSEWWHITYQSGHYSGPDPGPDYVAGPTFDVLRRGDQGDRVLDLTKKLAFVHRPRKDGHAPYMGNTRREFDGNVEDAVKKFQRDHHLQDDGEVGERTWDQLTDAVKREKKNREINALKNDLADLEDALDALRDRRREADRKDHDAEVKDLTQRIEAKAKDAERLRHKITELGGNPATA